MKKLTAITFGLALTTPILACDNFNGGFLPKNDLYIAANQKSLMGGLTEKDFNEAIDSVEMLYAPLIAGQGKKLIIKRDWANGEVNAYAHREGNNLHVDMFGGLARHNTVTKDGMALVVCHELGHLIGGAPKNMNRNANEGQADYFAALKCLRKVWVNDNNIALAKSSNAPKRLIDGCVQAMKNDKEDTALCIRTSMAGKSVSNLFAALDNLPEAKFETPDSKVVTKTFDGHPKAQCRLDTYFQGSLCDVNMNEDVSDTDEVTGTCHGFLGHQVGTRPLCWFKPSK